MEFTYQAYCGLVKRMAEKGLSFIRYADATSASDNVCILRHDVDFDLAKALEIGRLEAQMDIGKGSGVRSTFFILLNTDFYNPFSTRNKAMMKELLLLGHDIGLHFDENQYAAKEAPEDMLPFIQQEMQTLSMAIGEPVTVVSMHRPSRIMLHADLQITNAINSYSRLFLHQFKYLSDSRKQWREDIDLIINSKTHNCLHLLIHPFWYHDHRTDIRKDLSLFIQASMSERYEELRRNFTNVESVADFKTLTSFH